MKTKKEKAFTGIKAEGPVKLKKVRLENKQGEGLHTCVACEGNGKADRGGAVRSVRVPGLSWRKGLRND